MSCCQRKEELDAAVLLLKLGGGKAARVSGVFRLATLHQVGKFGNQAFTCPCRVGSAQNLLLFGKQRSSVESRTAISRRMHF